MSQNRSSAVMAQRHEPHDSLDFFPTPPWATRALVEHVLSGHGWRADHLAQMSAWDPCCGAGHMIRPLKEYFGEVFASDIFDYGIQAPRADFLMPGLEPVSPVDFLIFNPPFRLALEFIQQASKMTREAVCVLVRTSFLEGAERYRALFSGYKPLIVAPFVERVIMAKGRCMDPALLYWDEAAEKWKKPSTATAYCWLVFPGRERQRIAREAQCLWIPPSRRKLERPGDYDDPALTGPKTARADGGLV